MWLVIQAIQKNEKKDPTACEDSLSVNLVMILIVLFLLGNLKEAPSIYFQ